MPAAAPCTVGFAPHSGWAVAVVLGGTRAAPRVLARERVALAAETLPGCRQPYHALAGLPLPEARAALARFEDAAAALARSALDSLAARAAAAGEARGLAVERVPQRTLKERAMERCRSGAETRAVAELLGRGPGPPWGADQKSAALLAWLLLEARA